MASPPVFAQAVPPLYSRILSLFPQQYFRWCFAYGSGVMRQTGVKTKKPMIDLIFVVEDAEGFHGQNIHLNPRHYSALRYLGHRTIADIQEDWPANVYFNTHIPLKEEGVVIKYGVVSQNDLMDDLLDWNYLYLAGRLQKPVQVIYQPEDEKLIRAVKSNLYSALHAALLILPEFFTERRLYRTIAKLSYTGDIRLRAGEDRAKAKSLVDSQLPALRRLYGPLLAHLEDYVDVPSEGDSPDRTYMQDMCPSTRMYHLFQLPREPQKALARRWNRVVGRRIHCTEEVLRAVACNPDLSDNLSAALSSIVRDSSLRQGLKDLLTAGFLKSIRHTNKPILIIKSSSSKAPG